MIPHNSVNKFNFFISSLFSFENFQQLLYYTDLYSYFKRKMKKNYFWLFLFIYAVCIIKRDK
ncbi:hypothetical protein CYQ80_12630 [Enterococcus faecium]|nr:hypothetical protein CUS98_13460 [Enterococcus faecium]RXW45923.1 hypothetical protein CYQ80_12630 [Enterococcus faecium]RXW53270.1 hypothetical protein CYQ75_12450 [Enterococcus faecium]TKO49154.1 hypothetical protein DVX76_12760 [Enterococcus faecium]TNX57864.1 hypothetical protein FIU35_12855 [Enterococcus faecium]